MVTAEPPAKEWHLSATAREKTKQRRIAAIMLVKENGEYPDCEVKLDGGLVYLSGAFGDDKWSGIIHLNTDEKAGAALLELNYQPASGEAETINIMRSQAK